MIMSSNISMTFCLLSHCDIDAFCHLYNKAFMYLCNCTVDGMV